MTLITARSATATASARGLDPAPHRPPHRGPRGQPRHRRLRAPPRRETRWAERRSPRARRSSSTARGTRRSIEGLSQPSGLDVGPDGNLYVVNAGARRDRGDLTPTATSFAAGANGVPATASSTSSRTPRSRRRRSAGSPSRPTALSTWRTRSMTASSGSTAPARSSAAAVASDPRMASSSTRSISRSGPTGASRRGLRPGRHPAFRPRWALSRDDRRAWHRPTGSSTTRAESPSMPMALSTTPTTRTTASSPSGTGPHVPLVGRPSPGRCGDTDAARRRRGR